MDKSIQQIHSPKRDSTFRWIFLCFFFFIWSRVLTSFVSTLTGSTKAKFFHSLTELRIQELHLGATICYNKEQAKTLTFETELRCPRLTQPPSLHEPQQAPHLNLPFLAWANEIPKIRSKQPVHESAIPWCRARWLVPLIKIEWQGIEPTVDRSEGTKIVGTSRMEP